MGVIISWSSLRPAICQEESFGKAVFYAAFCQDDGTMTITKDPVYHHRYETLWFVLLLLYAGLVLYFSLVVSFYASFYQQPLTGILGFGLIVHLLSSVTLALYLLGYALVFFGLGSWSSEVAQNNGASASGDGMSPAAAVLDVSAMIKKTMLLIVYVVSVGYICICGLDRLFAQDIRLFAQGIKKPPVLPQQFILFISFFGIPTFAFYLLDLRSTLVFFGLGSWSSEVAQNNGASGDGMSPAAAVLDVSAMFKTLKMTLLWAVFSIYVGTFFEGFAYGLWILAGFHEPASSIKWTSTNVVVFSAFGIGALPCYHFYRTKVSLLELVSKIGACGGGCGGGGGVSESPLSIAKANQQAKSEVAMFQWLLTHTPGIPADAAHTYAHAFAGAKILTMPRVAKKVAKEPGVLSSLGVEEDDADDIMQAMRDARLLTVP